ncbi:DNA-processing protein DprA [Timonella sp. A28]|uniref:DNA-processing protein DprA n=1 Tax=Timonella sp. A28 TaxID=3442640 RepID=UPI003EBA4CBC
MITEIDASIGWARIAEPSDVQAGELISILGMQEAWIWLNKASERSDMTVQPAEIRDVFSDDDRMFKRAIQRWTKRLHAVDLDREHKNSRLVGAEIVTHTSPYWPHQLDDLGPSKPHCLWVRGDVELLGGAQHGVSIVGSRELTQYGEHVTTQFVSALMDSSCTVVSGGAFGVDACAHRTAVHLEVPTLAVFAGGIDRMYPAGNKELLASVIDAGGALVSEVPVGAVPMKSRFLSRNRIIAALSRSTVVIEAAWRSGALSTAHHALEIGRDVGAVPGPITSAQSAGCHRLLRETPTQLIGGVEDFREFVFPHGDVSRGPEEVLIAPVHCLTDVQRRVLDALSTRRCMRVDEVSTASGIAEIHCIGQLGGLESMGLIRRSAGGWMRVQTSKTNQK